MVSEFTTVIWSFEQLLWGVLVAMGMTILALGPEIGPIAWIRNKVLRPVFKFLRVDGVLDCMKCFSFWAGLFVGIFGGAGPFLAFVVPTVFWLVEKFSPNKA